MKRANRTVFLWYTEKSNLFSLSVTTVFKIESITMSGTTDAKVRSRLSFLPDYNEQDHLSRYLDEPVCRLGNAFRLYDKNQPVCRRINSLNSQYYTGCPESRCTNLKHKCVSHGEMKKKRLKCRVTKRLWQKCQFERDGRNFWISRLLERTFL